MNTLFYGDNLDVLRQYVKSETVDLVYLDPPFKSDQDYNVLFAAKDGTAAAAQIQAFEDTWHWDTAAVQSFKETVEAGGNVASSLLAFEKLVGQNDMLAYLAMMAPRLVELHKALKPTGALYLHCDPTAGHYLKLLLDAVFGPDQFCNEIIWRRSGSHNSAKRYGPIHDTLLFYSKSDAYKWRRVYRPYLKGHVESYFQKQDDRGRYWTNALTGAGTRKGESGQPWKGYNPTEVGRHWAVPGQISEELGIDPDLSVQERLDLLDEAGFIDHPAAGSQAMPTYRQYLDASPGMPLQDIWAYQPHTKSVLWGTDECIDQDVRWLLKQGDPERLGYPTQKPVGLMKRVILSSSDEGDLVLDPFCGCGTTVHAAQLLNRRWIGIDVTIHAVALIEKRLNETFPGQVEFQTIGVPSTMEEAVALAERDKHQFQGWVVYRLGAGPREVTKGADKGIDGRLYFRTKDDDDFKQIVVSVKGGHLKATDVRDLRAVVEREGAAIGVLASLDKPTRPMRVEAATAGTFESPWGKHPRIQLLTVAEMLAGKGIDYPPTAGVNVTLKTARRAEEDASAHSLFGEKTTPERVRRPAGKPAGRPARSSKPRKR